MVRRFAGALLFLTVLLAHGRAHAWPPDTLGLGARSTGLGGAVVADVGDTTSNYYNPAGLAQADGIRISAGYLSLWNGLEIGGQDAGVGRIGAMQIGLAAPVRLGSVNVALGLSFHLDDKLISRVRSPERDRPRWDLFDDRAHKIYLGINLAIEPVSWLRIGVGMALQSPSDLQLGLSGDLGLFLPEETARLNHTAGGSLISTRSLLAGVQVSPTDALAFGVSYRGELSLYSRIYAVVDTAIVGVGDPIPLDIVIDTRSTTMFIPQQLVMATAVRPIPALRLSFDLTWADWSRHPGAGARETITVQVEPPPNLPIDVPDEIPMRNLIDMNLRDTWSPRFGVEGRVLSSTALDLYVRGGYAFVPTGYPTQTGETNLVDADRHIITLGFGAALRDLRPTLPGALLFDVYGMFAVLPERMHLKSSPIDPVGDYSAGGTQGGLGVSMEVAFE